LPKNPVRTTPPLLFIAGMEFILGGADGIHPYGMWRC
jgi:hypothetical protein